MKLLLIGSALLSGGVMATEGEVVVDTVKEYAQQVQNCFSTQKVLDVQENGFPYPTQEFLDTLTEDQSFAIISYIDVANGIYDWPNMTEDEIAVAVADVRAGLHDLYLELGIEGPMTQTQTRTQTRTQEQSQTRQGGQGNYGGQGTTGGNGSKTRGTQGNQDGTCDYLEPTEEVTQEAPDQA